MGLEHQPCQGRVVVVQPSGTPRAMPLFAPHSALAPVPLQ